MSDTKQSFAPPQYHVAFASVQAHGQFTVGVQSDTASIDQCNLLLLPHGRPVRFPHSLGRDVPNYQAGEDGRRDSHCHCELTTRHSERIE